MTTAAGAARVPLAATKADWRIERLTLLMDADWLAGEWDPGSQLILPQPGGRLHGLKRCVVVGCPSDGHWDCSLCVRHRRQFDASGEHDIEAWLARGEPAVFTRRRGTDQACVVAAENGRACPRPAVGRWQLCQNHCADWWKQRTKGRAFEEFLARAQPLSDIGGCVAACCYRPAAFAHSGLCLPHALIWRDDGRPRGAAFSEWAVRVRQPVNSRVLSLRGMPELVRLELVYAIGSWAADQVTIVTGGMRPWIDQLRSLGVGSMTDFDLRLLEGIGDRHHVRFARFRVDLLTLVYTDPEAEQEKDVWDLRRFGRTGAQAAGLSRHP